MFREWLNDKSGSIAVIAAVVLPVTVGFIGVGAEISYWYFSERRIQSAADAAAFAGAVQLRVARPQSDIEAAGVDAADRTGFDPASGTAVFNTPPLTGAFTGETAVEAILTETIPPFFTAVFGKGPITLSGRAVALVLPANPACVIALDTTASGAVTFSGTSASVFEDCDVVTNSVAPDAVLITGSGDIEVDCLAAVGGVSTGGSSGLTLNDCPAPVEDAHEFTDPYAGTPPPDTTQPCEAQNVFSGPQGSTYNITPGRYCGGLQANRNVNLAPGVYVIDGGSLSVGSVGSLQGSGVTFYLTNNAGLSINATSDVQISAPTSGPYSGMAIFADPLNSSVLEYNINGDADSSINGAIYAPSGTVVINGSSSSGGGCTQVVSRMVRISGNAGLGSDCTGTGVNAALGVRGIELVE